MVGFDACSYFLTEKLHKTIFCFIESFILSHFVRLNLILGNTFTSDLFTFYLLTD
jgi:hypothetical protein